MVFRLNAMLKRVFPLFAIIVWLRPATGAAQQPFSTVVTTAVPAGYTLIDSVSIDSLMETVEHLSGERSFSVGGTKDSILTRYSYGSGFDKAERYLVRKLESMGYEVERFILPANGWFDPETELYDTLYNLIVTKQGTVHPEEVYILGAHYDSISDDPLHSAPGADDNASGTAAVVEAARVLRHYDMPYTVRFILFAEEEQGMLGSYDYVESLKTSGETVLSMINLDMIAYDGNDDGSMEIHAGYLVSSLELAQTLSGNIASWDLDLYPELKTEGNASRASDHRYFWSAGIPAVMVIEDFSDFTPHYHSTKDSASSFNTDFYLEMARLAICTLADLSGLVTYVADADTADGAAAVAGRPERFTLCDPYPNPFNGAVTLEFELGVSTPVTLEVVDGNGRRVRNLVSEHLSPGHHQVEWDGLDRSGHQAASGLYIVRLIAGGLLETKKIALVR